MSTAQPASIDGEDLEALVRRAAGAESDAQDELVRRFQDMAVGYAWSVLGDRHLAEDASQDAFVAALKQLPSLREPAAFPAWFRRVLYKHCDRMTRGRSVASVSLEQIEEPMAQQAGPAERLERREMERVVQRAIATLPAEERSVVHLFYTGRTVADGGEQHERQRTVPRRHDGEPRRPAHGDRSRRCRAGAADRR
jgi:RNA polymerase sigma factor (sigma-70 family)